jgi:hypothetical protein
MQHTVIGLFDTYTQAEEARDALVQAGFARSDIALQTRSEPTYASDSTSAADTTPPDHEGMLANLERFFASLFESSARPPEVAQYAEAVRRGAVMVSVDAATDAHAELARSTLARIGAIDVEERAQTWHAPDDDMVRAHSPLDELGIRRRTVAPQREPSSAQGQGPARSYPRSSDKPQTGARWSADDPAATATAAGAAPGMGAVFPPGHGEPERSAAPRADLTEAAQHAPTEPSAEPGKSASGPEASPHPEASIPDEFLEYEEDFRRDYDTKYAGKSSRYADYKDAYRYGATVGRDARYRNRPWTDVEPHAQRDWETAYPHNAWARFKEAVRHGWDRVTGHDSGRGT